MKCQRCGSLRILHCNAHASDRQTYSVGDRSSGQPDYAPNISDICDVDALFPKICLDCGQTQGSFPKETPCF